MSDKANQGDQELKKREQQQAETKRAHWLLICFGGGLVLSVIIYLGLHWAFPPGELLPETRARDEALTAIVQATEVLTDMVTVEEASETLDEIRTAVTNTVGAQLTVSETQSLNDAFAEGVQNLTQSARNREKARGKDLTEKVETAVSKIPWVDTSGVISGTIARIEKEISKEQPDLATLRLLFARLDEEVRRGGDRYFWSTGFGRWVEFAFWACFGTLTYLLATIHTYYPKDSTERRFRDYTPWYFTTALRGPIMALLILFFITSVEAEVSGIKIALGEARIELLIFAAGVLGFFSRVAREELELLVEKVFPEAWQRAQGLPRKLAIKPSSVTVKLGAQQQFTVEPDQDVFWSHEPKELGILTDGGRYTAPKDEEKAGEKVTIKATSVSDPAKSAAATVTLSK